MFVGGMYVTGKFKTKYPQVCKFRTYTNRLARESQSDISISL